LRVRDQASKRTWVAKRIDDKRLLKLIRAFLNAGVMENGLLSPSVEGVGR
jgi:retron-type reverse transcriptase